DSSCGQIALHTDRQQAFVIGVQKQLPDYDCTWMDHGWGRLAVLTKLAWLPRPQAADARCARLSAAAGGKEPLAVGMRDQSLQHSLRSAHEGGHTPAGRNVEGLDAHGAVDAGRVLIGRAHASGHEEFTVARKCEAAYAAPFVFRRQFLARECLAVERSRGSLVLQLARHCIPHANRSGTVTRGQPGGVTAEGNAIDRVAAAENRRHGMATD